MSQRGPGRSILYVTVDGVLKPLAYSQVGRVVMGLAGQGFRYDLLSLESPADLAEASRVADLERRFAEAGVQWTRLAYDEAGNAKAAASNLARLARELRRLAVTRNVRLVHARAYHAATVALAAKRLLGIPYVFDARGRWIDERLQGGRWFTNPAVELAARAVERRLYQAASGLVTLTQLHADDIVAGDFGRYSGAPLRVVTTCADFSAFELGRRERAPDELGQLPRDIAQHLHGKLVVALIGSTNPSYRHQESLELAKRILARRTDAHLLVLSGQRREFLELLEQHRLPQARFTLTSAAHEQMPDYLSRIDWAIQLLNAGVAKRGSMPTKLAEFFAAGVRPIHFGCNDEVSRWVEQAGSGLVLPSLEPAALDAAADHVTSSRREPGLLMAARARAQEHFDLAGGLRSYRSLLAELGLHPTA